MLNAKDSQFKLGADGVVSYQAQESNPLPGVPVAKLVKGEHVLRPGLQITDAQGLEEAALQTRLQDWFKAHLKTVLELLVALEDENTFKEPTKQILAKVHDAMGIVPREELEEIIAKLDAEDRKDLRAKRVRLGPILVFIPALNKPAAVRLRGLLWALFHGHALPAKVPNDGIVSCVIEPESANKDFYQAIGYPVYGRRAIRIDMLDRVICAVYDSADKGKFKAKHEMAEWLGSPIDDLYQALEAMGHVRLSESQNPETQNPESQNSGISEEKTEEVKPEVKPELATFRLKKGKAFEKAGAGGDAKKPAFKKPQNENKKSDQDKKKQKPKSKRDQGKGKPSTPRVVSIEAKSNPEDSPFAILGQLKK